MDLVDFSQERYDEIAGELRDLGERLGLRDVHVVPISALRGDNVVDATDAMPWYEGPTLLEHLETVEIAHDRNEDDRRFPVQWVIRPMADEFHDYRGYAGQVAVGDLARRRRGARPPVRAAHAGSRPSRPRTGRWPRRSRGSR